MGDTKSILDKINRKLAWKRQKALNRVFSFLAVNNASTNNVSTRISIGNSSSSSSSSSFIIVLNGWVGGGQQASLKSGELETMISQVLIPPTSSSLASCFTIHARHTIPFSVIELFDSTHPDHVIARWDNQPSPLTGKVLFLELINGIPPCLLMASNHGLCRSGDASTTVSLPSHISNLIPGLFLIPDAIDAVYEAYLLTECIEEKRWKEMRDRRVVKLTSRYVRMYPC